MKRNGFTFWEAVFVLGLLLLLAAILFPVFFRGREPYRGPSCRTSLKQIGLGILQYVNDYDGKYPSVVGQNPVSYGWADAIYPYVKNHRAYWCPTVTRDDYRFSRRSEVTPDQRGYTDYWINGRTMSVNANRISYPACTILGGEGNDGNDLTDARYNLSALPQNWIDNKESPIYRHLGTFNLLFCDGHVKSYVGKQIGDTKTTTASPAARCPTFAFQ